jgi:hypothetical protein
MGLPHLGSGQPGSSRINMLGQKQDLIFSIVRKEGTAGNYLRSRADIVFGANTESSLMDVYFVACAGMVSIKNKPVPTNQNQPQQ